MNAPQRHMKEIEKTQDRADYCDSKFSINHVLPHAVSSVIQHFFLSCYSGSNITYTSQLVAKSSTFSFSLALQNTVAGRIILIWTIGHSSNINIESISSLSIYALFNAS